MVGRNTKSPMKVASGGTTAASGAIFGRANRTPPAKTKRMSTPVKKATFWRTSNSVTKAALISSDCKITSPGAVNRGVLRRPGRVILALLVEVRTGYIVARWTDRSHLGRRLYLS